MNVTLKDYLRSEDSGAPTQPAASYQVNIQLNEFTQAFQIPITPAEFCGYQGYLAEAFLDIPDILERFEVFRERLNKLSARMEEIEAGYEVFENQLGVRRREIEHQLDHHQKTFLVVEDNPAAASRRSFLQSESIRLESEGHQVIQKRLNRLNELEQRLYELLPEYLHLRRVAQSVRH